MRKLDPKPGETISAAFDPPPFNPDAWRGKLSATVAIGPAGDRPLAGEEYRVSYHAPELRALARRQGDARSRGPDRDREHRGQRHERVRRSVLGRGRGERLGEFKVLDRPARQDFSLRMPLRAGDLAAVGVAHGPRDGPAGQDRRLSRPDRLPGILGDLVRAVPASQSERLANLGKRRGASWSKDVALVAIGIDNERDALRKYVLQHGLGTVQQLWSPQDKSDEAADTHAAYSITGVPTAFLIGRDGRIVWRGHPASLEMEAKIEALRTGVK